MVCILATAIHFFLRICLIVRRPISQNLASFPNESNAKHIITIAPSVETVREKTDPLRLSLPLLPGSLLTCRLYSVFVLIHRRLQ